MSVSKRFHSKYVCQLKTGCWEWTSSKTPDGYGKIYLRGKQAYAHRVSYSIHCGDIGDYHVLHKCDNPSCVNPAHLFLGTHSDNMKDRSRKGKHNGESHGRAKLSDSDIAEIRSIYSSRIYTQAQIADAFGISPGYVSRITRGECR